MTAKNEAVRLFLAATALILTAMLTNPLAEETTSAAPTANVKKVAPTKQSAKQSTKKIRETSRKINRYVVVSNRQHR